jgi:hypothetical protein
MLNGKMRSILILLIILTGTNFCLAEIIAEREQIPQLVFENFYRDLPADIPVVLDLFVGDFTPPLENLFKEKLLEDGYELYEEEQEESLVIRITYGYVSTLRTSGFFPVKRRYREENHLVSYQLTKIPERQILDFENLTITTFTPDEASTMRWYDPLIISAIIGTLAYLFYFGGS